MRDPRPPHGYLVGIRQVGTMADQEAGQESFRRKITIEQAKDPASDSVARCHQRGRATFKNLDVRRLENSGIEMAPGAPWPDQQMAADSHDLGPEDLAIVRDANE